MMDAFMDVSWRFFGVILAGVIGGLMVWLWCAVIRTLGRFLERIEGGG